MPRLAFSFEQVRSFVAVADNQQISKAAAALYLTQGAVTQQVRHFERAVGLQLLERDGRGVRLTDAGRSMADACRAALRAIEMLDDTARAMKELQAGSLHIGASPTSATYYLPQHLAEFSRRHPGVKLHITVQLTAELNRQVAAGMLDCALVEGVPDPSLKSVELSKDELLLVAHRDHPLSHLRRAGPADLVAHRYLRRAPDWSGERYIRQLMSEAYDQLDALDLGQTEYVRAAVVAGLGFAALPKRAVAGDLASGVLKRIALPPMIRTISAIRRPELGGPAQEAFWSLLTGEDIATRIPGEAARGGG